MVEICSGLTAASVISPARGTVKLGGRWVARRRGAGYRAGMTPAARSPYAGHRFPPEVISHAVWLYFRFPLALRMVEELLAARGIMYRSTVVRHRSALTRPWVTGRS